jgi:hypothetical protein
MCPEWGYANPVDASASYSPGLPLSNRTQADTPETTRRSDLAGLDPMTLVYTTFAKAQWGQLCRARHPLANQRR